MKIKLTTCLLLFSYFIHSYNPLIQKENCIFLYGGGYSGYWYTLSRLKQYHHQQERFICYSSACVSLVHSLQKPDFSIAALNISGSGLLALMSSEETTKSNK